MCESHPICSYQPSLLFQPLEKLLKKENSEVFSRHMCRCMCVAVQLWDDSQGAVSEQGLSLTQPGAHQFSEARQPLSSRDAPVITSPTREHRHVLPRPLLVVVSSSPSSPPRLLQCLFVLSHSVTRLVRTLYRE